MHPFLAFLIGLLFAAMLSQISKVCFYSTGSELQILARQAARWSLAAEQDKSPLVALLHANYGTGYLWAMSDIATPEQISRATGLDYTKFKTKIVEIQDKITKQIVRQYPTFSGESDIYLSKIAGKA